MRKTFYHRHRRKFADVAGLFSENPVLARGLVLAPVVVASYSAENSWVLGLAFSIVTFVTVWISSFFSKKIPYTVRVILHTLLASGVFIPTAMLIRRIAPEAITRLGVFLPLLVINSLVVVRSETQFFRVSRGRMTLQLLGSCLGFFWAIFLVGCLRELLGNGSFFGKAIPHMPTLPALLMPFGGFILVGFLAALLRRIVQELNGTEAKVEEQEGMADD